MLGSLPYYLKILDQRDRIPVLYYRWFLMIHHNTVVLLSTFNGQEHIKDQIQSIVNQDNFKDIDLLIRDDGSTDGTIDIINHHFGKYSNIKLIKGENVGLIQSFFNLLQESLNDNNNYQYFSFCDQDDCWLPMKVETAIREISSVEKDNKKLPILYGCKSRIVDEKLQYSGKETQGSKKNLSIFFTAIQNIVPGHNQVMNRSLADIIIKRSKNLDEIYSQDYWFSLVASVTGNIIFDNKSYTLYRMHGNNELGYGTSKFSRMLDHLKRLNNGETRKMSRQLLYFKNCFSDYLTEDELNELADFFSSQKSAITRFKYTMRTKLQRQGKVETFQFKLLYMIGSYKPML
ncbi:glycosyltransferase [Limosilactobacillus fermentum]|uniref:glycosyltransferase n=1 Tax=Limosilactobacillus fermentum TaxID=1613 RepID=UPI002F26702A